MGGGALLNLPRAAALAAVVLWGISFVATKAALAELAPLPLLVLRFGLGAALVHSLLLVRRRWALPPRDALAGLAGMGFVGVFVHQMLQAHALELTTAVNTGWLIGLIPVWAAIFAAAAGRERFPPAKLAGLAIGFAGALLVVTRGRLSPGAIAVPAALGDLLIVASTVNWAIYTNFGQHTLARVGAMQATAWSMLAGWLMLLPFALARHSWRELGGLSSATWGAVLFLGIGCSGLGYLFWYGALEQLEPTRVAAFLYLEPLVTQVAATALIAEPLSAITVAGGALVLLGVALVQRAPANNTRMHD